MRKALKTKLSVLGVIILSVVVIACVVAFGMNMNAFIGAVIFEIAFNFIYGPKLIKLYYQLHDVQPPSAFSRYMPFLNVTKIISPLLAWASMILVGILAISFILLFGLRVQTFLSEVQLFKMFDLLPSLVFLSSFLYFIVVGLGLTGLHIKITKEHKEFFKDEDLDEVSGTIKFLTLILNGSSMLLAIVFMLPVFRIAPMISLVTKTSELYVMGKRL